MKTFIWNLLPILMITGLIACRIHKFAGSPSGPDFYRNLEFDMPVVKIPEFEKLKVSVTDFGAVPGGQALNTEAFAGAIDRVSQGGGGTIIVPRGIWLTGPIVLKSNINLHTESGALVVFSRDKTLYPLVETSFEGLNTVRCQSPISGKNLDNIAITGEGIFDGSGEAWRHVKRSKLTSSQWKELVATGGLVNKKGDTWYPSESYLKGEQISEMNVPSRFSTIEEYEPVRDFLRPVMVSLVNCRKVLIDGPAFQNSPAWCIHPLICEDLTIRNVSVRNPWFSQNGDGLDIESCKNSQIYNCTFDVGDDAICIKSGKDKDGRDRGVPTENLIISKCVVYHGHGGVTIGSEMSGGVKNMHVSGCTFIGTDVGLRFKSNRGRGGVVENIFISDIDMMDIPTQAISFNLFYTGKSVLEMMAEGDDHVKKEEINLPVTEETPSFRNVSFRNITCKGARQAIYLEGLPEMNLQNLVFKNLKMEADEGLSSSDVNGLKFTGLSLITKKAPAIALLNTANAEFYNLTLKTTGDKLVSVNGEKTRNIIIQSDLLNENPRKISSGNEVPAGAVQVKK